jgi:hypothetical protein
MDRIDFLKLMKDGLATMTESDLEELVASLLGKERSQKEQSPQFSNRGHGFPS